MRLFGLSLRLWAFRQFMYELEHHPRDSEDASDFAKARRQLLTRSVLGGHLDDRCFVSMEPDFPELGDPAVLADDGEVVRIACAHLDRYLAIGEERSGVLAGYLRAQRGHLLSCARCRSFVCAAVRKDVGIGKRIRSVLGDLSDDDRRELAEEFVPAHVRRRGDVTLN